MELGERVARAKAAERTGREQPERVTLGPVATIALGVALGNLLTGAVVYAISRYVESF